MWQPRNIKDVKNVLGMRRTAPPVPEPAQQSDVCVLRFAGLSFSLSGYGPTSYCTYTYNGTTQIETISPTFTRQIDEGTDVILSGTLIHVEVLSLNCIYCAAGNTLSQIEFNAGTNLQVLDLRNLNSGIGFIKIFPPNNLRTIYASDYYWTNVAQFINESVFSDGVLFISVGSAGYATLAATAQVKGWQIVNL